MKFVTNVKLHADNFSEECIHLVQVSIPFKQGVLNNVGHVKLVNDGGSIISTGAKITHHWPNGSIKWVLLEWTATKEQLNMELSVFIDAVGTKEASKVISKTYDNKVVVSHQSYEVQIDSAAGTLQINEETPILLSPELKANKKQVPIDCTGLTKLCEDESGTSYCLDYTVDIENKTLNLKWIINFRPHFHAIESKIQIHNPGAASHDGGLWDLGDPASVLIDNFAISIRPNGAESSLAINEKTIKPKAQLELIQHGSGGVNWQSTSHVLADGTVPIKKQGYVLTVDDELSEGKRVNPKLQLSKTLVVLEQFWQNFPSAFKIGNDISQIELLANVNYEHELQGGEKKSYTLWLASNNSLPSSNIRIRGTVPYDYLQSTDSIFLCGKQNGSIDSIDEIVKKGLSGKNNFFEKRELIDEYGWRNFGDLFADHETLGENGKSVSISHYNNQYDPLFGFLTQFLITGDNSWFELAEDLAKHIKEIDFYDTFEDRDEYNHGLFWHTDHYLDAETCSHRTFSKKHTHAYDGYTSGGGPGGQHCYTAGLSLYYLLTGDQSSKDTVTNMYNWVNFVFDGSDTLIAKIFGIRKSGIPGIKNQITGEYPLDRGTGHLVVVHLDMFSITNDQKYLDQAFDIIQHTISPFDDISKRNFENIEGTWFYTVFLQSVSRFLHQKEQLNQFDYSFEFARRAFLLYIDWMSNNELPYLEQKEKLEFPNSTWTAQDIRKSFLFFAGNYFDVENDYIDKGNEFYHYVSNQLKHDNDSGCTRILAILMQNYLAKFFFQGECKIPKETRNMVIKQRATPNKYWEITKIIFRSLIKLSPKKELKWLAFRSSKVAKIIGNK